MSSIDFHNVRTMVGADAILKCNIKLEGGLIIYGKIKGDVTTTGTVRFTKTAEIAGNVIASDIQIYRTVK